MFDPGRTPSSGPFWMGEQMGFPRAKYWDRLLALTGCPGIHFADYPAVASFVCPEWSHLKPADAVTWTINLVDILQKEKGWVFPLKLLRNNFFTLQLLQSWFSIHIHSLYFLYSS